jgi:hypothetical protein
MTTSSSRSPYRKSLKGGIKVFSVGIDCKIRLTRVGVNAVRVFRVCWLSNQIASELLKWPGQKYRWTLRRLILTGLKELERHGPDCLDLCQSCCIRIVSLQAWAASVRMDERMVFNIDTLTYNGWAAAHLELWLRFKRAIVPRSPPCESLEDLGKC